MRTNKNQAALTGRNTEKTKKKAKDHEPAASISAGFSRGRGIGAVLDSIITTATLDTFRRDRELPFANDSEFCALARSILWLRSVGKRMEEAVQSVVMDARAAPLTKAHAGIRKTLNSVLSELESIFRHKETASRRAGALPRALRLQEHLKMAADELDVLLLCLLFATDARVLHGKYGSQVEVADLQLDLGLTAERAGAIISEQGLLIRNGLVDLSYGRSETLLRSELIINPHIVKPLRGMPFSGDEYARIAATPLGEVLSSEPGFHLEAGDVAGEHDRRAAGKSGSAAQEDDVLLDILEKEREPACLAGGGPADGAAAAEPATAPHLGMECIIADDDTIGRLMDIVHSERAAEKLFSQWGFGEGGGSYGMGTAVLLHGDPGTGKTFAAQVIASELGLPLKLISTEDVLSKWVGDTGRNIAALFAEALKNREVLLFDEADALFAGRTRVSDATDRFANSDVNLLLQKLERHKGMVILTTNLRENLDQALFRRFRYIVDFRRPDAGTRARLWRALLPAKAPLAADTDLAVLATRFDLTGGQIKNAVFRAASRAILRQGEESLITQRDLLKAAAEERGSVRDNAIGFK